MTSRIRFPSAQKLFDAFPTAAEDIALAPTDAPPEAYCRQLMASSRPTDALVFCAYLLPRREAVWWAAQCVRVLRPEAQGDAALAAAEAWVREPDETARRAALNAGDAADMRAPSTWLAKAAAFSGGSIAPEGAPDARAPAHVTARALRMALIVAVATRPPAEQSAVVAACVASCFRFAEGGDARPDLRKPAGAPAAPAKPPPPAMPQLDSRS